jgi:hypothetical protein
LYADYVQLRDMKVLCLKNVFMIYLRDGCYCFLISGEKPEILENVSPNQEVLKVGFRFCTSHSFGGPLSVWAAT